nr:caspase family protein [Prevotella sp.]
MKLLNVNHCSRLHVSFLCLLMVAICLPLSAQTTQDADAAFKEFVRLNNTNGDRTTMFNMLYTCYTDYVAIINHSSKGSDTYNQAKVALKTIYPYLQNGAGFFSQNGNQQNATAFARACVDLPLMDAFIGETFQHDNYYPTIVYFAACNTYNASDYTSAIKYLNEYLRTGDTSKRKTVLSYLYQACMKVNNSTLANSILDNAVTSYPTDFDVLSMAVNACIDSKDYVNLSKYVSKALLVRPNDPTLMNIQGKMYEDTRDFENALKVYTDMHRLNQKSLSVVEHLALNTYNLGVMYYNKAALETKAGDAKKLHKTANDYFSNAAGLFSEILMSNPTSLKYTQALAIAYSCMGDAKQLDATNVKLAALGGENISSSIAPSLIGFDDKTATTSSLASTTSNNQPALSSTSQNPDNNTSVGAQSQVNRQGTATTGNEIIPHYSDFAKDFLEKEIKAWENKDQFETMDEYKKRVTNETLKQKVTELQKIAEQNYISHYAHDVSFSDMKLMPYDADNQSFLIKSRYGDMVLPVPREKGEAKIFESNWNGLQFKDSKYYITGDTLALASLTFVTPTGSSYKYDNQSALTYTETKVNVNFAPVDYSQIASTNVGSSSKVNIKRQNVSVGSSDVDTNIPSTKANNDKTFAIIISNEHYQSVPEVAMANNDGATFAKYCQLTLGIPENNIRSYPDATFGGMIHAMQDIRNIASAYNNDINVIFYYAGHGIPNEATKDAYLLPVDADGTQTEVCYSLNKLYRELSSLNAKSVVVFLDACFSGATSEGGNILASARGVALKAKKEDPRGNMVVFSAASDDETAFPYKEKGHGLFTYFLLKKLQESKGNVTLKDLSSYISDKVKQQSIVVNRKAQTPTVSPSAAVIDRWQEMKLRP